MIHKPFRLGCPCNRFVCTLTSKSGEVIGRILQRFTSIKAVYDVINGKGEKLFTFRSRQYDHRICDVCCCFKVALMPFDVIDRNNRKVGEITQKWKAGASFAGPKNFHVVFPANETINVKCLLMAGAFMIKSLHFD